LATAGAGGTSGTTVNTNQAALDTAKTNYDTAYTAAAKTASDKVYSDKIFTADVKDAYDAYDAAAAGATKDALLETFKTKAGIDAATTISTADHTAIKAGYDAAATSTQKEASVAILAPKMTGSADAAAKAGVEAGKVAGTKAAEATSGAVVNGNMRTVAAKGFDVLNGTVDSTGATNGSPLEDIDAALKAVDTQRSILGASQNRF
ncbi:hypothetical protein OGY08_00315, partial [Citrobacter sp. Cpo069]|nr:hypothetical protein [Citrobacter sp. Cpo069]